MFYQPQANFPDVLLNRSNLRGFRANRRVYPFFNRNRIDNSNLSYVPSNTNRSWRYMRRGFGVVSPRQNFSRYGSTNTRCFNKQSKLNRVNRQQLSDSVCEDVELNLHTDKSTVVLSKSNVLANFYVDDNLRGND